MSRKPKGRAFLKTILAENVKCTEIRKIKPRKHLLDIIRMSFDVRRFFGVVKVKLGIQRWNEWERGNGDIKYIHLFQKLFRSWGEREGGS